MGESPLGTEKIYFSGLEYVDVFFPDLVTPPTPHWSNFRYATGNHVNYSKTFFHNEYVILVAEFDTYFGSFTKNFLLKMITILITIIRHYHQLTRTCSYVNNNNTSIYLYSRLYYYYYSRTRFHNKKRQYGKIRTYMKADAWKRLMVFFFYISVKWSTYINNT